ncbi:MAG: restriction endonuclease subunit S [Acidimicrobiales bacterium]
MSVATEVALGEVASIVRTTVEPDEIANGTCYVGLDNIVSRGGLTDVRPVASGDLASTKLVFTNREVLFGKLRPYLAKIARPDFGGVCSTDILPIRPGNDLDRDYLAHYLAFPPTVALAAQRATGANLPRLSPNQLKRFTLPLPSLEEQRRVARVLDMADALREKRRRCLRYLHALIAAIYTDLFQGEWRQYQLGDVLDRIDSGSSPVCETRPASGAEWGVLKLGAISFGRYDPGANKALLPGCAPRPADEVRAGDILLARKNTRELVGASVLVHDTPDRLMLPDLIFRLVPAEDAPLDAAYLQATLAQPRSRAAIARLAGGSAGSMPNISKARLRSIEVDVPPIERQQSYAERSQQVELIRQRAQAHLAHLDALFACLQARAFAGDL